MMDELIEDTRRLADDLRASGPKPDSVERVLLNAVDPFLQTLEADGQPQRASTEASSRFCTESLDWSSPLFIRCASLVERARARL